MKPTPPPRTLCFNTTTGQLSGECTDITPQVKSFLLSENGKFHFSEVLTPFLSQLNALHPPSTPPSFAVTLSFVPTDSAPQEPHVTAAPSTAPPALSFASLLAQLTALNEAFLAEPVLCIVRHAVRLDYIDLDWVPQAAYPPLHASGIAQSKEVGQRLKDMRFDVIVSSPYFRSTQTARYIAKYAGMKYHIEPGLSEFLSKVNRRGVPEFDPARLEDKYYDADYTPVCEAVVLETWSGIVERVYRTAVELTRRYRRVCFVTHRSTTQAFLSKILGEIIKDNFQFTSVCYFEPRGDAFVATRMDSHFHLTTFVETPLHNPNYAKNPYKDMIRGPDGNILPSNYIG